MKASLKCLDIGDEILPTKHSVENNDGLLQIYKYMNIKISKEIIVVKYI